MQMCMWNLIRSAIKNGTILLGICMLLTACTKKKETVVEEPAEEVPKVISYSYKELMDEFFETLDESLLESRVNCIIDFDYDQKIYTVYGGFPEALWKYTTDEKYFSVNFVNKNDELDKGCAVLFFTHIKENSESKTCSYLTDVKYIPAKEGYCVLEQYLAYGLRRDGTCREDDKRYGFTLIPIGGWYPYDKKIVPDYILSFEESGMLFEVPTDDEYFLYQSSHFDGI